MKTILYQPLFINPQAYFVFPQLYHIEKGDSYIEPANITGQLIINNLSEGLTLTPTVNVIQDSNQVDFSLFKGKHIRISQYTNIGAVVLGEWYIPGTPEPEQPDWFKESIVAWYSPCKQKLTNYDVIESYIIDFTTFDYRDGAIINNNKFVFTGKVTVGIDYRHIQVEKYNSYKILIKGLTGNIYYYYRNVDGVENHIIFKKDGIYDIPVSYKKGTEGYVMGYTCNSTTECTVTQLPTSILKDFSGNKHDAYLYGFKGKLNSGVGIYAQDFKNWSYGLTINNDISTKSYQLCYDGKSYAVAYGLPILTDYTVIADRTWFAEKVDNGVFMSKALEQNGAFILEYKQGDKWNTYSYYSATNINIDKDNSIVYQTKNKYNEQTIYPGDKQDTDTLFIGTIRKDDLRSFIGCHSDILLFNRTLTEYEISWVKNNLMCSKP